MPAGISIIILLGTGVSKELAIRKAELATERSKVAADAIATSMGKAFDMIAASPVTLGTVALIANYGLYKAGYYDPRPETTSHSVTVRVPESGHFETRRVWIPTEGILVRWKWHAPAILTIEWVWEYSTNEQEIEIGDLHWIAVSYIPPGQFFPAPDTPGTYRGEHRYTEAVLKDGYWEQISEMQYLNLAPAPSAPEFLPPFEDGQIANTWYVLKEGYWKDGEQVWVIDKPAYDKVEQVEEKRYYHYSPVSIKFEPFPQFGIAERGREGSVVDIATERAMLFSFVIMAGMLVSAGSAAVKDLGGVGGIAGLAGLLPK